MRYEINSFKTEQVYMSTACFILMRALVELKGRAVNVHVANSLNQGVFVYLDDSDSPFTTSELDKIDDRMQNLINADTPIVKLTMSNEEATSMWLSNGVMEKAFLLGQWPAEDTIDLYEIDGYRNCFYGELLPSAGYVELYELRRYKNGLLLRIPSQFSPDKVPEYRDDWQIYEEYSRSKQADKKLGLNYLADLNERIMMGDLAELVNVSEQQHEAAINELAKRILKSGKRIILIAGPSSSGKTTFANRLCKLIAKESKEPVCIGTDDYFLNRELIAIGPDGHRDFEGLGALNVELLNEQLMDLYHGKTITVPSFDFITGTSSFGDRTAHADEDQIIIVEGIHSLNDSLTPHIPDDVKFRVYITPLPRIAIDRHNRLSSCDARLLRRMIRDVKVRGRSPEETLSDWIKVRRGEQVNIFPYSSNADFLFNSNLIYETSIIKAVAGPQLEAVPESSPNYPEAQRLLNFLRYFKDIDDVELIPKNSILREFVD